MKREIEINERGQWVFTPSIQDEKVLFTEKISIEKLEELTGIKIERIKGGKYTINIPIPLNVRLPQKNFADIENIEELRNAVKAMLENEEYGGWIVPLTMACFDRGTNLQTTIFKIIRGRGEDGITRKHLIDELKQNGYKDSGTVNGTLQALCDIIGVVKSEGEGPDRKLTYIGKLKDW